MSNNVRGKRNPFNGPLSSKTQTVGNTYGARRDLTRTGALQPKSATAKPADKFNHQKNVSKNAELFQANAKYRTGRHSSVGDYKSAILKQVEKGKISRKRDLSRGLTSRQISAEEREVTRPSDGAILNFLDYIIKNPEVQSATRIRRNSSRPTRSMGNPVESK